MSNLFLSNRSQPVLVACALIASAMLGTSISRADTCRSWHLDLSAQFNNPQYDEDGNLVYEDATSSGYVSHMGAVSAVGMNYFSPPENGILMVDGDAIFTAANGDQIFASFDGTVIDLVTDTGTGSYVVTGGTGRFKNATGSADFSSNFAPNGFTVVANGTLCY